PMGVHTGDSITIAPALTLTDKEYQIMRDASIAVLREIGVETGGSNRQFAVNPEDGRLVVIEMNPRVSRSSALASKATGFPIAKIAAKLAVGYRLDEVRNDITRQTPASFEPAIDYCVVKFPRWAFEKFPEADRTLTTQMKSVGEVMAIGRTFKEALQKSIRSLEQDQWGLTLGRPLDADELRGLLGVPTPDRIFAIGDAYRAGLTTAEIQSLTRIDPWFLENMREIVAFEPRIVEAALTDGDVMRRAKQLGFADRRIAQLTGAAETAVRARRLEQGIRATVKTVDTCPAELGLKQAAGTTVRSLSEAQTVASAIGYPVLVRPSYVLGGRAMRLVHDDQDLREYMGEAVLVSPEHPVLIDKFLEDAIEVDVDAVADAERVVVGGVMEHIEKAGIHSGDAACTLPPYSLGDGQVRELRAQTRALARALGVVGLINVQFAIRGDDIYVLEVNPRASRTVPFVSKAIGQPLAKI